LTEENDVKPNLALSLLIFFAVSVVSQGGAAQVVYKCSNPAGKIEFSDAPCPVGLVKERVQVRDNTMDMSGTREQILLKENEQLRKQLKSQEAARAVSEAAPRRTQADLQAERLDTAACQTAKRDYEVIASSKGNSEEIVNSKRSAMFAQCGMQEPAKQTIIINQPDSPSTNVWIQNRTTSTQTRTTTRRTNVER
jgi:hypothetical protein